MIPNPLTIAVELLLHERYSGVHLVALCWRMNNWTRQIPDGPVYFDAPPSADYGGDIVAEAWADGNDGMFMLPAAAHEDSQDWPAPLAPCEPQAAAEVAEDQIIYPQTTVTIEKLEDHESSAQAAAGLRVAAPEFVPIAAVTAVTAVTASPGLGAALPPNMAAVIATPVEPAAPEPQMTLQLSEESPDITVTGCALEWTLSDSWGKMRKMYKKGMSITSPTFGVHQANAMQLMFFPNGSKAAEAGHCTVALTREPESAGIKFEFVVSGRSSGPKVCLGRRYLGDYPRPFDESEESKDEQVVITMTVLEVFGANSE
eukprot:TRINITY_DN28956_c0_g1_i2.p1 TRINITY_DN28956_c0_g1~~TRINITY_DN28956_c0_g1_i2.p1  ORF type:complete len:315 (-),score=47.32 TRINITY_DN28956_c0_g1_i2:275-1219(-)